jgi:uncharacterized membrane protein YfcA
MVLAAIGAGVGYVSALTGTGGPVSLMPVLLALKVDVLSAVGLGQAIQVPIGALATAQHSQSRARRGSVIPVLVDSSERRTRRATVE